MSERKFIAAVAKGGKVRLLFGDGDEPEQEVADGLLALGVEPESVAALQKHTALAKARRAERRTPNPRSRLLEHDLALAKARSRAEVREGFYLRRLVKAALACVEHGLDAETIPWCGFREQTVLRKARHDNRHPDTGQYRPAADVRETKVGAITWRHNDTRKRIPWALEPPRGLPANADIDSPTAYDGAGANAMGHEHPHSSPIY